MITYKSFSAFAENKLKQFGVCFGLVLFLLASVPALAQGGNEEPSECENTEYNLVVGGGSFPGEVSWSLLNDNDEVVADGGAPIEDEVLCLADGCYTLEMVDSWGDGWNGNEFSLLIGEELVAGPFTVASGSEATADITLGDVACEIAPILHLLPMAQ
ncbi:MAG: hypothetical protein LC650_02900 [Actinobacteria bacterium]|nr:hypothetical protein [Actinomycetota bacterium]